MRNVTISALFDLTRSCAAPLFEGKTYPWEVLDELKAFILDLGGKLPGDRFVQASEGVWIARSAKVAPTAYIGAPCIIDEDAEVRHCAYIRGSAIVGRGAVVGNSCELKNCILFDGVQVPHFNYVGDSVLGHRAHLGAGAVTSNVKGDRGNVTVKGEEAIATGRRKLGSMVGDFAEIGCGAVLNPGSVIGRRAQVYPLVSVRGVIPADSIVKAADRVIQREQKES